MGKIFVDVIVKYSKEGQKIPLIIIWGNGKRYEVDKVLDIRQAPSLKCGGQGTRYTCKIMGKETYIWLDDEKWFVEEK